MSWYRSGVDVAAGMGLPATYLGHVNPVDTYWYLKARELHQTGEKLQVA